mgnify:FL=1
MLENNTIKSISEHVCPNCKETLFVETQMTPATTGAVFTTKEMESAKLDCLKRIETTAIDEEKKQSVIKWVQDPATIFGPTEVDSIVESLLRP